MDHLFEKARSVDLVHYLASLGHHPTRINDRIAYYKSPKRDEGHASFEVNRVYNSWADWGESDAYGSPVDFVMWMTGCTELEAANKLVQNEAIPQYHKPPITDLGQKAIEVLEVHDEITNATLRAYLEEQRKIPVEVANKYCKQVLFWFPAKKYVKYWGMGLENDKGGWGIRGVFFKGNTKPAGISTTKFNPECVEINLYEGVCDFLSHVILQGEPEQTCVVLNSLIFIPMMTEFLQGYDKINLYLDNDPPADMKIEYLLAQNLPIEDCRDWYNEYNDINDYLIANFDI